MRRAGVALILALLGSTLPAASALGATPGTFEGACEIAGPIEPEEPINVVPRPGARFSFYGKGACTGELNGRARDGLRARLDVHSAQTLFDSCELGPDLGIPVKLAIRRARGRWVKFPLTLQMFRVTTIGPFILQGAGGGSAHGLAQLVPPDFQQALVACGDPQGGITVADLRAAFETAAPLAGAERKSASVSG